MSNAIAMEQGTAEWTDSLDRCSQAAVAPPAARSCFCQLGNDTYLYGIFDTHNGTDEAHFVLQRIAAEILLGQLNDKHTDEEIKEVLSNAFLTVEKVYMESINDLVLERANLQQILSSDLNSKLLNELDRLKKIDERLSIGVTSVIALIHNGKLFVANIGDSRALLCKTDVNCVLRVVQLSVDHSLKNEDELLRLSQLGLDMNFLRKANQLGNQSNTRCLGNYYIKTLYQNLSDLKNATDKPVIALPEVHGPINLEDSCRFLVLMSDKLYKNLQEAVETEQVNKLLAQMIVEQFRIQPSLEAVCQSVIDKVSALYLEHCTKSKMIQEDNRDTLLIRNFNFSLPNAILTKTPLPNMKSTEMNDAHKVRFNPIVQSRSPNTVNESDVEMTTIESSETTGHNTNTNDSYSGQSAMSTITSQSSTFPNSSSTSYSPDEENKISMYNNKRIEAYVDFSEYYKNVEQAKKNGTLPTTMKFDF